jgi:thymidylate kinase
LKTAFEATKCEPSLYIYIKKSPEDCFAAIQTRRQAGDSSIELSYLEALDALYERMLEKIQCKKVVIDATGKTPAEIHSEIITVLKSSNELHSFDA